MQRIAPSGAGSWRAIAAGLGIPRKTLEHNGSHEPSPYHPERSCPAPVSLTGAGAYAASQINGANIKNGTIAATKLTPKAVSQLRGARGPAGADGAAGPVGSRGSAGAKEIPVLQARRAPAAQAAQQALKALPVPQARPEPIASCPGLRGRPGCQALPERRESPATTWWSAHRRQAPSKHLARRARKCSAAA